jgi:hypothetical protein
MKKKKKKPKHRNPYALPAKTRSGAGKHKPKQDKRKTGRNKQRDYLGENY